MQPGTKRLYIINMKQKLRTVLTCGKHSSAGIGARLRWPFGIVRSGLAGLCARAGLAGLESPWAGKSLFAFHGTDRVASGRRAMAVSHPPWKESMN